MNAEEINFVCIVCLYVRPRPDIDEDSVGELSVLTVTNGQMVCIRHAGCASQSQHETIMAGVHLESNGTIRHLSEYQDWRHRQDQPGATA